MACRLLDITERYAGVERYSVDQLAFIPVDFAVAWVAGLAVRAWAEQAEVAESHATQAEQQEVAEQYDTGREERDAATRVAVAEERVRIAASCTTSSRTPSA